MSASNKPRPANQATFSVLASDLRADIEGLYHGSLGHTVRCTPSRRTVRLEGAPDLYGKWRSGGVRDAAAEWHWLHVLPLIGLSVPSPVAWLGTPRRSLLVTEGVRGRSMDAWMVEAAADGWLPDLCEYAIARIAPAVRRLHDNHIAYRDLYWNHILVVDPRSDEEPTFLDVERAFRPRWRWRRWVTKDLAGLLSSTTVPIAPRLQLRFLRAYTGGAPFDAALIGDVERKAARIRAHVPRYG